MDRIPSHYRNYTTRRWVPSSAVRDLILTGIATGICLAACCGVYALDAGAAGDPCANQRSVCTWERRKNKAERIPDVRPAERSGVSSDEARELVEADAPELVSLGTYTLYAYCPCPKCCGQWSGGLTASGTVPEEGRTVAADWDVLPAGTELYIEGVGWRVVEDTGAGIDGQALDIYMDSHADALRFGVQEMEVWQRA